MFEGLSLQSRRRQRWLSKIDLVTRKAETDNMDAPGYQWLCNNSSHYLFRHLNQIPTRFDVELFFPEVLCFAPSPLTPMYGIPTIDNPN